MKLNVLAAAVLTSMTVATPIAEQESNLLPRTTTVQLAKFDDLKAAAGVPVPYLGLNFTNLLVRAQGSRGIIPQSPTQYLADALGAPSSLPPDFNIYGTPTASFDLTSFYFACMNAQTNAAVKCQFTVTGLNGGGPGHQGPTPFSYTPSSASAAVMVKYDVGFVGLKEAYVQVTSSDAGLAHTATFVDSVKYTTYS